jgi:hypothetical protein
MTVFLVVDNVCKVAHKEGQGGEVQAGFMIFFRPKMDRRERYDRTVTESIGCKRTNSGITVSGITVSGIRVLGITLLGY